ncbi:MAG: hypothetical protein ABR499_03630 [Gemmatimonadaceae bacterium]
MYAPRRCPLALFLGAVLLSAAACSDATAPNGDLTPEEARELAAQIGIHLSAAIAEGTSSASAGSASLNAIPTPFSFSADVTVRCPRGGTARLMGTISAIVDKATRSITADVTGTHRPNDCGFPVHGKTFRTTGSLSGTAHFEAENGLPVGTHTATLSGEFSWRASDGRRGTCTVNYTASANYTTNVAVVNGSFCGSTIQFTGPLTS